jgi:hypothetical protein
MKRTPPPRAHFVTLAALLVATLLPILHGSSVAQTPAAWPTTWISYVTTTGWAIKDGNDENPIRNDVRSSTCDSAVVKIAATNTTMFFRMQVPSNVNDAGSGGFVASTWIIMLYTPSNTHMCTIGLDGKNSGGGVNDYVYVTNSTGTASTTIYTWAPGSTAMRATAVNAACPGFYWLDFQVPISAVANYWAGFDANTPFIPLYGTSNTASANHQINKDVSVCACTFSTSTVATLLAGIPPATATYIQFLGDNNISLLPVELVSFNAQSLREGVLLKWTTATEVNNHGFAVEASSDQNDWSEVVFIRGSGTSNVRRDYMYLDAGALNAGEVRFYRLRQVDRDGTEEYSQVVRVQQSGVPAPKMHALYPNPAHATAIVSYDLPAAAQTRVTVVDMLGRELLVREDGYQTAGSYTSRLETAGLPAGLYTVTLSADSFVQSSTLVIAH